MNSQGQNIGSSVDELGGHAQMKREVMKESAHSAQEALDRLSDSQSGQNNTYSSHASTFLSQKGEQVKSMAQGAAEAVKNTLGMSNENPEDYTSTTNINNPINPSTRI
ncbi:hypothetical protein LWI29_022402 [Acer saccharum]|uniref:Uncharacterized protein n=1 Tax=Acer saccharum TaxID=4024 RepID=A0AA39SWL3_ACESA|nr:hypothetical protein LWI29_022402 [Acer saccharum]